MIAVVVKFSDGNEIRTSINATLEEARRYYLGQSFQFGDTDECPEDRLVRAVSCDLIAE